jgi:uncharacterized protein (TIGR02594 family)
MDANKRLIEVAKKYVGVKESGGDNKGPEVEKFQKAVDGKASGEAWCMCFVQYCIKEVEKEKNIKSKVFSSEHVMTVWNNTPKELRLTKPEVGSIMIWSFVGTASGHAGFVTKVGPTRVDTIEGNTGDGKGIVREGDGVYERNRSHTGDAKMKVMGWLKVF